MFLKKDQIGIIRPQDYTQDNQSMIALCWLDWLALQKDTLIRHAGNGGEEKVLGHKVDGVDLKTGEIYELHGCFYHGCPRCYSSRDTVNPVNGLTMQELYDRTQRKTDDLRRQGKVVHEKWECDFKEEIKNNQDLLKFYKKYEPYEPLVPKDAFFGGRTNAIRLYCEPPPGFEIRYADFTSLYPWVCKYGVYPLGHHKMYAGEEIPDKVDGLIKCKVLPPTDLFHPVLPMRVNGKLLFPLCRTCAGEGQEHCDHNEEERALTGTWVSIELEKAVEKGYKILKRYSAWHYEKVTQYDPNTKTGGLWSEYINLWLKLKQQAEGYPSYCKTEEDKPRYIDEYEQKEGIRMDPECIVRNEGMRSLAKLMLNSHWGKFGQNPNKTKITYVAKPKEYINTMQDSARTILDVMYANREHIAVRWNSKDEFVEPLPNTNVVLAAFTTAQARLKLFTLLEKLGVRVLYMDTDCEIYLHVKKESLWNPPLGIFLGELKDETKGVPITVFVSGGPKNYAYRLEDHTEVCKVKGLTLNHRNRLILNFQTMKELVTTPDEAKKAKKAKKRYDLTEPHKIIRKNGKIYSKLQEKQYRLVYDKRILTKDLTTFPYGWRV